MPSQSDEFFLYPPNEDYFHPPQRSNKRTPNVFSSTSIRRATVEWLIRNLAAASRTVPLRISARKTLMSSQFMASVFAVIIRNFHLFYHNRKRCTNPTFLQVS